MPSCRHPTSRRRTGSTATAVSWRFPSTCFKRPFPWSLQRAVRTLESLIISNYTQHNNQLLVLRIFITYSVFSFNLSMLWTPATLFSVLLCCVPVCKSCEDLGFWTVFAPSTPTKRGSVNPASHLFRSIWSNLCRSLLFYSPELCYLWSSLGSKTVNDDGSEVGMVDLWWLCLQQSVLWIVDCKFHFKRRVNVEPNHVVTLFKQFRAVMHCRMEKSCPESSVQLSWNHNDPRLYIPSIT
jgi:hypothetical protein